MAFAHQRHDSVPATPTAWPNIAAAAGTCVCEHETHHLLFALPARICSNLSSVALSDAGAGSSSCHAPSLPTSGHTSSTRRGVRGTAASCDEMDVASLATSMPRATARSRRSVVSVILSATCGECSASERSARAANCHALVSSTCSTGHSNGRYSSASVVGSLQPSLSTPPSVAVGSRSQWQVNCGTTSSRPRRSATSAAYRRACSWPASATM